MSALSMLVHARQHRCAWDGIDALFKTVARTLDADCSDDKSGAVPFSLLAMPLLPRHLREAALQWSKRFRPSQAVDRPNPHIAPGDRLRIGFVSADFRGHAVAMLMTEFWERLDRGRFETFAYGIMPEDSGPIGQRIRKAFEHFADVSSDSAAAIAQRIRDDRIAILFDLNGYTSYAKPKLFALRPAPLQINCIGYPDTLGAEWYDYILVDRFLVPPAMRPYFTERFLEMPNALFPCDTTRAPKGPPPMRAECGLPEQGFVFCCFNASYKILPAVFAVDAGLLHAIPDSVLWLVDGHADAVIHLRREAARAGIASERLVFAPRVSSSEHIARCAVADLFLDTAPYGAGATANDALLAGLPIVTCAGDTLVSRICGSQLHAIGLPELVTTSLADYEALALRLAQHPLRTRRPARAAGRQSLHHTPCSTSPAIPATSKTACGASGVSMRPRRRDHAAGFAHRPLPLRQRQALQGLPRRPGPDRRRRRTAQRLRPPARRSQRRLHRRPHGDAAPASSPPSRRHPSAATCISRWPRSNSPPARRRRRSRLSPRPASRSRRSCSLEHARRSPAHHQRSRRRRRLAPGPRTRPRQRRGPLPPRQPLSRARRPARCHRRIRAGPRAAPGHIGLLNNLGVALQAIGERERAFECYRLVLSPTRLSRMPCTTSPTPSLRNHNYRTRPTRTRDCSRFNANSRWRSSCVAVSPKETGRLTEARGVFRRSRTAHARRRIHPRHAGLAVP